MNYILKIYPWINFINQLYEPDMSQSWIWRNIYLHNAIMRINFFLNNFLFFTWFYLFKSYFQISLYGFRFRSRKTLHIVLRYVYMHPLISLLDTWYHVRGLFSKLTIHWIRPNLQPHLPQKQGSWYSVTNFKILV